MSVSLFEDPKARARSLMHKQKSICDGCQTGYQCRHYLEQTLKVDAPNSDHLHQGETVRFCLLIQAHGSPLDLGDGGADMAVRCNHYEPSNRAYDPQGAYKPLTPEEVAALEEEQKAAADAQAPTTPAPEPAAPAAEPEVTAEEADSFLYGDES